MSAVSARITKLEKTLRAKAREEFSESVNADFGAAIDRLAGDTSMLTRLLETRRDYVKANAKKAEDAALEKFLTEKAPEPTVITLDALYNPVQVRIAANGERLPDTATDYVAVLLPQFDLLYTVGNELASSWKDALKKGAAVDMFDGAGQWQLWDDTEAGLTIDRRVCGPAVIESFRAHTPNDYIYWTRTPYASSPSDRAIYVNLSHGNVHLGDQNYSGRIRAVRRVRASQFGVLACAVSSK